MTDLTVSKNMIIKGNSRRFETSGKLLDMLQNMSLYQLPNNYIEDQQNYVNEVEIEQVKQIIKQHLDEQNMIYLVVGDARTQLSRMKELGYGEPIILDIDGQLIN